MGLKYQQITQSEPEDIVLTNKKIRRTCHLGDFAIPVDHRMKRKEKKRKEKINKYLDLARELKSRGT